MTNESDACAPMPLLAGGFNSKTKLPYGLTTAHIRSAMASFIDFLGFVNAQLHTKKMHRLESFLMPANFSSIVGEFMSANIPKNCPSLVNNYHNGHPDMVPKGLYGKDSAQHELEGVEVKGSRNLKGWQGHNPEDVFLMVFCFDSNRPVDVSTTAPPRPFGFVKVLGAKLKKSDWKYAGRGDASRRTPTAAINASGYDKMEANWIYRDVAFEASVIEGRRGE